MGLRLCDITMFYPTSSEGGVKNYILAKKAYCLNHTQHAHATIVPAASSNRTISNERDYLYEVASTPLPWNPAYRALNRYKAVAQALLEYQPDIIEMGDPYFTPWLVQRLYRKAKRRPLIVGFYHADFPQNDIYRVLSPLSPRLAEIGKKWAQRYATKIYNRCDHTFTSSPMLKDRLSRLGIQRIMALPFGVDTELFHPVNAPNPNDAKLQLLYVGRLSTDKGILPFIELMHRLVAIRPQVTLTIVGSGFLENRVRAAVGQANYIKMIPAVSDKTELARLYSSFDLLIVPNPHETFCLSALEAMACGTPVAALHGLGGIQTIVNETTGFLLGEQLSGFLNFLSNIERLTFLAMRPQIRQWVVAHSSQRACFAHLFSVYEELHNRYVEQIAHE